MAGIPGDLDAYCVTTTPWGLRQWAGVTNKVRLASRPAYEQESNDHPDFKEWVWIGEAACGNVRVAPEYKDPLFEHLQARYAIFPSSQDRAFVLGRPVILTEALYDALEAVGVPTVRVSLYGCKSLISINYAAIQDACELWPDDRNVWDIGQIVPGDAIVLFRVLPNGGWSFRSYPCLHPLGQGEFGGVETSQSREAQFINGERFQILRIKLYNLIVHWLKAASITQQRSSPQTLAGARQQREVVATKLALLETLPVERFCGYRIEVTVSAPTFLGAWHYVDSPGWRMLWDFENTETFHWLLAKVNISPAEYLENVHSMLAISQGILQGNNNHVPTGLQKQVLKDLWNALGWVPWYPRSLTQHNDPNAWWHGEAAEEPGPDEEPLDPVAHLGTHQDFRDIWEHIRPQLECSNCNNNSTLNSVGGSTTFRLRHRECGANYNFDQARDLIREQVRSGIVTLP
ncbi:hypothetical protein OC835_007768 [Tilletia horrida]|uniref:Uncharacterized protein n=1 Tax=Tilletia horrida TaxID=155126 RepID=A0AAN6G5X2_9BASI|nr:hypothetical protein OC842_007837 [Tilletia horrida]KAK0518676.1 hypothetical protein OC835_007768 [Tilletia horrida]